MVEVNIAEVNTFRRMSEAHLRFMADRQFEPHCAWRDPVAFRNAMNATRELRRRSLPHDPA